MVAFAPSLRSLLLSSVLLISANAAADPCSIVGGQKWVSPKDLRACFRSFQVDQKAKENIIEVINKTLAFHTSTNYEKHAPFPFSFDVHENVPGDLARISAQRYPSDYDLHIDLSRSVKRLDDGHCVWINSCYDSLYVNYLPTPLSLITDRDGEQRVHISYEAFDVASAEFKDGLDFWQNALPGQLKGQLATLSGARVLEINGDDPFDAVDANAAIAGGYQAKGTRQNSFFSSYTLGSSWAYRMGDFALQTLPLSDSVTLKILRVNHTFPETITIPYRARILNASNFTNTTTWRSGNCVARATTNGKDYYSTSTATTKHMKQPIMNEIIDAEPKADVALPPTLTPSKPVFAGGVAQFYLLNDTKTGVLALGSFSDTTFIGFISNLLTGLQSLKTAGATQLIVDVTNNGGGYVCAAHWLHRIIIGPKATTEPQAGLDTKARAGPLARLITKQLAEKNLDPQVDTLYNSLNWFFANDTAMPAQYDWLDPPVPTIVNGYADAFSQRLGTDCPVGAYGLTPPPKALFDPKKIAIISNGRCASSCSLFSITMAKEEGVKTLVIGGNEDVPQQYCGVVGGQSTDFATIDSDVKTAKLKNHTLAPPDLIVNGKQGITWRLGFGIWNKNEPEEWQSHPADINLPVTADLANNPVKIWEKVVQKVFH